MATLSEIYPVLARIVGEDWRDAEFDEFVDKYGPYVSQLEADLRYLSRTVPEQRLIRCFRSMLTDPTQRPQAIYEIYTDVVFASISDAPVELHVPKTKDANSKEFDFRVRIKGCEINGEVKTRKDEFPFNVDVCTTRPLVDPCFTDDIPGLADKSAPQESPNDEIHHKPRPESVELRKRIEEALSQVPKSGRNIVVIGHVAGDREHLENALYGDPYYTFNRLRPGEGLQRQVVPNGLFSGQPGFEGFNELNAVIWLRLVTYPRSPITLEPYPYSTIRRWSKIYFNTRAPFCPELEEALIRAFDREEYLRKELQGIRQKIIDDYGPEKIILFGSLASGDVHEWSDIDLVVIKETSKPYFQRLKELALLVKPKVGANFFVYTPSELEAMRGQGNFFIVDEVLGKGKVIYDRTGGLAAAG